ncbi:MAG: hypothetical protein ABI837_06430 [Acidobacteriota bacterium]
MKNRWMALALYLVTITMTSSAFAGELIPMGPDPLTLGARMEQLRSIRAEQSHRTRGPRADVVSVDWELPSFIIPVAGNLQGNNGTFFRSDVTIANRRSQDQIISVGFIVRGVDNSSAAMQRFTIGANTTSMNTDLIGQKLGKTGLGSILVIAETSAGSVDTDASLDGFSRIWTPQPGSSGTVSQSFEAIDPEDSLATSYGYGLRQDGSFRTNVGLVNLNSTSNTFTIFLNGSGGQTTFTQTVKPNSMEQVAVPAGNWGDFYIRISSDPSNFNWWSAYGTSVDNVTGDGWVSHVH